MKGGGKGGEVKGGVKGEGKGGVKGAGVRGRSRKGVQGQILAVFRRVNPAKRLPKFHTSLTPNFIKV